MIVIKNKQLELYKIIRKLNNNDPRIGSSVIFCGFVRDFFKPKDKKLLNLEIECYQEMVMKVLYKIELIVKQKWNIIDLDIYHRVGKLKINDLIVFINVSSEHREDSFLACKFIIDHLKIYAPFWKKEIFLDDSLWVDQKKIDLEKVDRVI